MVAFERMNSNRYVFPFFVYSKDIVLARSNLLLDKAIKANPEMVKGQVIYWDAPPAVLAATQSIFNIPASKSVPVPVVNPVMCL